jgi:hypothetical protein
MYNDIRVALESHLYGLTNIPEVDWENVAFETTSNEEWLQARLVPAQTRPAVAGPNPQERYSGTFLVNVFWPSYDGPQQPEALAADIKEHFSPGTVLTYNSKRVHIWYSEAQQPIQDPPYYQIPVVISWYVYI